MTQRKPSEKSVRNKKCHRYPENIKHYVYRNFYANDVIMFKNAVMVSITQILEKHFNNLMLKS